MIYSTLLDAIINLSSREPCSPLSKEFVYIILTFNQIHIDDEIHF